LFKSCIGECLFKANTFNKEGVGNGATSDFLNTNVSLVEVFAQVHDSINNHVAEKFLSKGSEIAIEGKLITKDYVDKEGNKKYSTEIQVNELLLLGSKSEV
jgi:single-stranded DNA-binding protein